MKNTANEIRASADLIAEQGGFPKGLFQALVEHKTGYRDEHSILPDWRETGDDKEHQLLNGGLRLQEKMAEFGGNLPLAAHAYLYGDKRTAEALQTGFKQDEIDNTFGVMARMEKYGGEDFGQDKVDALSNVIGKPSRNLDGIRKAVPPKAKVPSHQITDELEAKERKAARHSDVEPNGISTLRSALFGGESGGDYNIVNRGKKYGYRASKGFRLVDKTVDEVLADQMRGNYKAAGAYQIIPSTLKAAKKALGLTGKERFTPELQDKIFANYLAKDKRPPLRDYIMGKSNDLRSAHTALAQEWASVDRGDGLSYYHKDGVNKAGIPLEKSISAVQDMRAQYQRNIAEGMTADNAYYHALVGSGSGGQDLMARNVFDDYGLFSQQKRSPEAIAADNTIEAITKNREKQAASLPEIEQAAMQGELMAIEKNRLRELAKGVFSTRKSLVPYHVSQAIKGALT